MSKLQVRKYTTEQNLGGFIIILSDVNVYLDRHRELGSSIK